MNFPSAFVDSPLNKQEWKTYWSNELADVFFGGNVVTDSGDPVEVIDETGIYKDLIASSPVTVSYFTKREGPLFTVTIKVFVSADNIKLLKAHKATVPKEDELLIYLEHSTNEKKLLLVSAGSIAENNIETIISKDFADVILRKEHSISQTQLEEIIKSCQSKSYLVIALQKIVGAVADAAAWSIDLAGDLFFWIGKKIKQLKIEDATWRTDHTTDIQKWLDEHGLKIDKLFDNFFDNTEFKIPIPENIKKLVQNGASAKINETLTYLKEFIKKSPIVGLDVLFAAVCGIINGIVDLIAGIFDFIGIVLRLISGSIKAAKNIITDGNYYLALITEYAKQFMQAVSKINIAQLIDLAYKEYFNFMFITLPTLLVNVNINPRDVGYYVGYIGINVIICFIPLVDLVELTQITKVAKGLEGLFEAIAKAVTKTGKLVAKTAEELFVLLEAFLEILKKGTAEVANFIKKIFEAIKGWMEELLGINRVNIDSKTDELYRAFKTRLSKITGEEVLNIKTIKLIKMELWETFKVDLKIVGKDYGTKERLRAWNARRPSPAASFLVKERTIFIRSEVSPYTIEHELLHMKLWYKMTQELPEMTEIYAKLNELQHEEYVLAEFMKNFEKWSLKDLERDLETINNIRTREYGLNKVDFEYFKKWKFPE